MPEKIENANRLYGLLDAGQDLAVCIEKLMVHPEEVSVKEADTLVKRYLNAVRLMPGSRQWANRRLKRKG